MESRTTWHIKARIIPRTLCRLDKQVKKFLGIMDKVLSVW